MAARIRYWVEHPGGFKVSVKGGRWSNGFGAQRLMQKIKVDGQDSMLRDMERPLSAVHVGHRLSGRGSEVRRQSWKMGRVGWTCTNVCKWREAEEVLQFAQCRVCSLGAPKQRQIGRWSWSFKSPVWSGDRERSQVSAAAKSLEKVSVTS